MNYFRLYVLLNKPLYGNLYRINMHLCSALLLFVSLHVHGQNQLTGYEYWFDSNFAERTTATIDPASVAELNLNVSPPNLSLGWHVYNIRCVDDSGRFSSVISQAFLYGGNHNLIDAVQYWFDDAYELATTTEISSQLNYDWNSLVDASSLTNGLHRLHVRYREGGGIWSGVTSAFIQKHGSSSSIVNEIKGYRYWLDDAVDDATLIELSESDNPYELVESIDMRPIPHGLHVTHYQFQDLAGLWSVVLSDTIMKEPFPIAQFAASQTQICPGDSIHFFDMSLDADSVFWTFGDGHSSAEINPSHIYDLPGSYSVSLTAADSASGLDSTLVISSYITVWGEAHAAFMVDVNQGDAMFLNSSSQASTYFWSFGDDSGSVESEPLHTYLADGTYSVMLVASNLCGSDTMFANVTIVDVGILQHSALGGVTIFPNPFQDALHINVNNEIGSELSMQLYDANGREVATLMNQRAVAAEFTLEWMDATLPAGLYVLKIRSDDHLACYRVVKM